ncbi:fimbrial protein [Yersinia bercovieri]|uniref:fimbrial protein n=1 Tax=Yersinia bercovieri TaxID=634 RepID=UPI0036F26E5F
MITIVAISLLLLCQVASATAPIPLGSIDVKLDVTAPEKIEIENPKGGGWYNNIKLENTPENPSLFQAEVPVRVKLRRAESFTISVKTPLILTRETSAAHSAPLAFSPAKVSWGRRGHLQPLVAATPQEFVVGKSTTSQNSADYLLHISALAPDGQDTAGKYQGKLTLIFEINS